MDPHTLLARVAFPSFIVGVSSMLPGPKSRSQQVLPDVSFVKHTVVTASPRQPGISYLSILLLQGPVSLTLGGHWRIVSNLPKACGQLRLHLQDPLLSPSCICRCSVYRGVISLRPAHCTSHALPSEASLRVLQTSYNKLSQLCSISA